MVMEGIKLSIVEKRSEFANRLYELRTRNGLTQQKLAALIGVTQQSIWKWETDRSEPNIEKLRRLSELFQVPTDMLLGLIDMPGSISPADGVMIEASRASQVQGPRVKRSSEDELKRGEPIPAGSELVRASELEDVVRRLVLRYLNDDSRQALELRGLSGMESPAAAVRQ